VDFPASSPHALGCGGTRLLADPATGKISSEVVWNETAAGEGAGGGGVSDEFALPSWQADAGVPPRAGGSAGSAGGRGVPDVAGNADPVTGLLGPRQPRRHRAAEPAPGLAGWKFPLSTLIRGRRAVRRGVREPIAPCGGWRRLARLVRYQYPPTC